MPGISLDRAPLSSLPVVSRRSFLRGTAGVLAGVGGGVLLGCEFDPERDRAITIPSQMWAYAEVAPPAPEDVSAALGFFTEEEAATVEAFTAQLMPGTPEDPGAIEAGVLRYIDTALTQVVGYWAPTYLEPPFVETYTDEPPPEASEDNLEQVFVRESELSRYGTQTSLIPQEIYRQGLQQLDALCEQRFGAPFVDLSAGDQEEIMMSIEDGDAPTFTEPSADLFWDTIRQDTIYGMFADPAYGGNQDMVGWRLIGYPGAQRAYTPVDMKTEDAPRPPQNLDQLHEFNAGVQVNCDIVLPVSDEKPLNQQVPAQRE